mmetsp:Transcript_31394/g.81779  ORF Transcript_31394/g.81779 Transcript_31394/m.81779 type:complete len:87 (-) Transcript_31394:121-381(-)
MMSSFFPKLCVCTCSTYAKVKAVLEWPEPAGRPAQCKTQFNGLLGLANFNCRMVDYFAEPAASLNTSHSWQSRVDLGATSERRICC